MDLPTTRRRIDRVRLAARAGVALALVALATALPGCGGTPPRPAAAAVAPRPTGVAPRATAGHTASAHRYRLARFTRAAGWHTGASRRSTERIRGLHHVTAWASTVPYRDAPFAAPPHQTLRDMPADGIVMLVLVSRDEVRRANGRRAPYGPERRLPLRIADATVSDWPGQTSPAVPLYRLGGWVRSRAYDVDLWVFFGMRHPGAAVRARAQAELDRLHLPRWPPARA